MLKDHKKLHSEKNWFKALFSSMSSEITDPDSKQPILFFKMTFKSQLQVYTDKNKTQLLLESRLKREPGKLWNWNIFDMEKGEEQIGNISLNMLKTAMKFGAENWSICDAGGTQIMTMAAPDDSATKRILDNMSGLYNPTHHYVLTNSGGKHVGDITSKHGLFGGTYDLMLSGEGTEKEEKICVGLFSALVLMLRK